MQTVVFDTNVLLDIFVFNDFRAIQLKQALLSGLIKAPTSPKTLAEFADVIARPLFSLGQEEQKRILMQWQALVYLVSDESLTLSPWRCQDPDDQVFLDLAYNFRPCILLSKDNEVLKFAVNAAKGGVIISADYTTVNLDI
jgi:putative PIN family toxin of toxin-antitoxin system